MDVTHNTNDADQLERELERALEELWTAALLIDRLDHFLDYYAWTGAQNVHALLLRSQIRRWKTNEQGDT